MRISILDSAVAAARALGHPARLRIVAALRTGELCACQITELLGLAPSTVSAHLRELKLAGLVIERRDGRWVFFASSGDSLAASWISTSLAAAAGDPQLASDAALVEELRSLPVEDLCRLGYEQARQKQREESCRVQTNEF